MKNTVIDIRSVDGFYGISCKQAIIEAENYGRILICEGYDCKSDSYQWSHGLALKLNGNDTFNTLDANFSPTLSIISAALCGYDRDRTVLNKRDLVVAELAQIARVDETRCAIACPSY